MIEAFMSDVVLNMGKSASLLHVHLVVVPSSLVILLIVVSLAKASSFAKREHLVTHVHLILSPSLWSSSLKWSDGKIIAKRLQT